MEGVQAKTGHIAESEGSVEFAVFLQGFLLFDIEDGVDQFLHRVGGEGVAGVWDQLAVDAESGRHADLEVEVRGVAVNGGVEESFDFEGGGGVGR